jgi:hypothetical protein
MIKKDELRGKFAFSGSTIVFNKTEKILSGPTGTVTDVFAFLTQSQIETGKAVATGAINMTFDYSYLNSILTLTDTAGGKLQFVLIDNSLHFIDPSLTLEKVA